MLLYSLNHFGFGGIRHGPDDFRRGALSKFLVLLIDLISFSRALIAENLVVLGFSAGGGFVRYGLHLAEALCVYLRLA